MNRRLIRFLVSMRNVCFDKVGKVEKYLSSDLSINS